MKTYRFVLFAILLPLISFAKIPEQLTATPFTEYKFPSNICKLIEHQGTKIFIQANSFYLGEKLYEGEVVFKFRQFTDQLDILLNHIPMTYASADKTYTLESGGMFECYAYGNGKLLSFAPGKNMNIQLKTNFDIAGGELYKLNPTTKMWEKKNLFANNVLANDKLPDSKTDYWFDNFNNQEDAGFSGIQTNNTVAVVDPKTGNVVYELVQMTNVDEIFKTMNINEMGFYNCDKILDEQNAVDITVDFDLKGYNKKLASAVYVVYKNRNAVFTYYPDKTTYSIKLLAGEECTIFSFGTDGKIALADQSKLMNTDLKNMKNKQLTIPMTVIKNTPNTKAELAQLTGL